MLQSKRKTGVKVSTTALYICAVFLFIFCCSSTVTAGTKNSCIECHSSPNFAAFNKKIRNYFLKWENSYHADAGVTCYDCHGGNPAETEKRKAHEGTKNSIYFTDIPKTCGNCHSAIYDNFKESYHYKYLAEPDILNVRGANCVTCHSPGDPFMGMGANPELVENACELCHNYKTKNYPDIPRQALTIMIKLNAVKQQFNSLIMRNEAAPSQEFIKVSQKKIRELAAAWHSFDLKLAAEKTDAVLELLKKERKSLRKIETKRIYQQGQNDSLYGN